MSGKTRLKKAAVAISLSLLSLAASFNTAAQQETEPATPAISNSPAVTSAEPAASATSRAQQRLNIRLFGAFTSINQHAAMMSRSMPGYDIRADQTIRQKMDDIRALLNDGADPNSFVGSGITIGTATEMTAFQAAVSVSMIMKAPEFLQFFIDKGGDVHKKAPDQWSPMDICLVYVLGSQGSSPGLFKDALSVLRVLTGAGAQLNEARQMAQKMEKPIRGYGDIALNIVSAKIMTQQGLLSAAEFAVWKAAYRAETKQDILDEKIRNTPSLTAEWIKANGATLNDFPDAPPGGPEPYIVQTGDTLQSVAERFKSVMGIARTNDAAVAIARASGLRADAQLEEKARILIPMPVGRQLGSIKLEKPQSLMVIAESLKETYYDKNATAAQIARELAIMNNIDPARISEPDLIAKDRTLHSAYAAEMHLQFRPLTPPAHYKGGREVDLVVIEAGEGNDGHNKDTYRVSSNIAHAINPAVDQTQIHSWAEMLLNYPDGTNTDALRMLLNSAGSPINDRVVFSHSMAVVRPSEISMRMRQSRDVDGTMLYALINEMTDDLERSRPIIITASGNWNPQEMRHVQSYAISHSPRSLSIGAAGEYRHGFMMSPYSSYSADVCAPLPKHLGNQMEGTSFATPLAAALVRQFNEWYGDVLSYEEIVAAGLMSADRNVKEHVIPSSPEAEPTSRPAQFDSNGGGLPNHDRCGAGVLNPEKWQTALNRLVTIKQSLTRDAHESSYNITVGTPLVIPGKDAGDKTQYVYRLTMPADMTLGKLTFRLPQHKNKHSEIVVHTPGGFEKHLGYTHTDIFSSFAFAYEDVKAGQVIEIRTTEPLGPTAGMILRGHTPGNAIALLRDHLRSQGVLPAPLQRMSGDTVTGPSTPVTPIALKDFVPAVERPVRVPGLRHLIQPKPIPESMPVPPDKGMSPQ